MKSVYHRVITLCLMMVFSSTMAMAEESLSSLMHDWAKVNYQTAENDQEKSFEALSERAHRYRMANEGKAEPMIWEAIIKSTYAGAKGGLGALSLMEEARDLLLDAEKINPNALNGAVYTTLGSFYYMVPGWPIGFGDDDKALEYLQKGVEIAPDNMDANYFIGDYWLEEHKYKKAAKYLNKVLSLPDVEERPIYSQGRKAEASKKLEKVRPYL